MAAMNWENVVGTFADTKLVPTVTQRAAVASDGSAGSGGSGQDAWYTDSNRYVWTSNADYSHSFDYCWMISFDTGGGFYTNTSVTGVVDNQSGTGIVYTTYIGINANQAAFATGSPYDGFITQPANTWEQLCYGGAQNNTTSKWSFEAASTLARNLDAQFSTWQQTLNTWRNTVGDPTSDFQGSAANEFRAVLDALGVEFHGLQGQMNMQAIAPALDAAFTTLGATHSQLYSIYWAWRADPFSNPLNCLKWALDPAGGMAGASGVAICGTDMSNYSPTQVTITTPMASSSTTRTPTPTTTAVRSARRARCPMGTTRTSG